MEDVLGSLVGFGLVVVLWIIGKAVERFVR